MGMQLRAAVHTHNFTLLIKICPKYKYFHSILIKSLVLRYPYCNTPDVTFPICTPTLAVSSVKLFYFLGFGSLSPCVVLVVMHLISCHHVHCICIRVCLMHSRFFPVVRFAFRRFVLLRWSFLALFRVCGLNTSGLDRDLPSGLGLLPADRLSSSVPFGLRLILQRLTEGPKRPRVCCSPTPLQFGPKPT